VAVVEQQARKLELKLRQFEDLEMALEREREQVERMRTHVFAEQASLQMAALERAAAAAANAAATTAKQAMEMGNEKEKSAAATGTSPALPTASTPATAASAYPVAIVLPSEHFQDRRSTCSATPTSAAVRAALSIDSTGAVVEEGIPVHAEIVAALDRQPPAIVQSHQGQSAANVTASIACMLEESSRGPTASAPADEVMTPRLTQPAASAMQVPTQGAQLLVHAPPVARTPQTVATPTAPARQAPAAVAPLAAAHTQLAVAIDSARTKDTALW